MTQQLKLNSEIKISLKKVCIDPVTKGMLYQNFAETVQSFVGKGKNMNTIKGSPAYWNKFLHEDLVMVKQLVLLTFLSNSF